MGPADEWRNFEHELARHPDLYDLAPIGFLAVSRAGLILDANQGAASLLNLPLAELRGMPIDKFIFSDDRAFFSRDLERLLESAGTMKGDLRMLRKDGYYFWAGIGAKAARGSDGDLVCLVALTDVTERRFYEDAKDLTSRIVLMLDSPAAFRDCMSALTAALKEWSGCTAVGIRLRDGDDFPYYETLGFPPAHVQMENRLCSYGPHGELIRDASGNPLLDCMCGNILVGRTDPSLPFFTAHGSFWSNCTTTLLATTTDAERQVRTRNRCNGEGYESVALVPLRSAGEVFGLLQFNDERTDRFSPDLIAHFETLADNVAVALARRRAEERLRAKSELLENIIDTSSDLILVKDRHLRVLLCNRAIARMLGKRPEELVGKTDLENGWDPETVQGDPSKGLAGSEAKEREVLMGKTIRETNKRSTILGGSQVFDTIKLPLRNISGEIFGILSMSRDASARTQEPRT